MRAKGRIRQSKPASIVNLLGGLIGIAVGIFFSLYSPFGLIILLIALVGTVLAAIDAFSARGIAHEIVEIDVPRELRSRMMSAEQIERRLADLESLKSKGLIRDEEYADNRKRILSKL